MKVRIAGFTIAPSHASITMLDHPPVTTGFARATEWVEVDLAPLSAEELVTERAKCAVEEIATLEERIAKLRA